MYPGCAICGLSNLPIMFRMNCIVCLDACFTQKRRHSPRDAEHQHPASVFLDKDKVQHAEEMVSRLCQFHGHPPAIDYLL